jgi:threonine/homoserine/homoserine lactone efflux protein
MIDTHTLWAFTAAFTVFAASPGPDNITIFSKTVTAGPSHGLAYGAGVVTSIYGSVLMATAGLTAVSDFLSTNLSFLQYVGAAYLVYMGVSAWRSIPTLPPKPVSGGVSSMLVTGFLLNISNPKMPLFYLALLPGVFGVRAYTTADIATIIAIITAVEIVVVGGHVLLARKARQALSRPRPLRIINRVSGGLMVGAAVLIASR